jgi:hypothetical protein
MTEQEQATLPEARLGGALLWMVAVAGVLLVIAVLGILFAQALRDVGGRYMLAIGFIVLWSVVFIVMTLVRLRATPVVASAGLLLWIAYRLAVAIVSQAGWPLTVDLLGEVVLAAGFCGYMAEGVRPNAYYRHRLPAL